MSLQASNIKPLVGSEVSLGKQALLDGTHAGEIRELLDMRGVLVFHDVGFDADEQLAFAATLGDIIQRPDRKPDAIALSKEDTSAYALLLASVLWHFDGAVEESPPGISMLSARRLADEGGKTEFCNLYAAYEALSEEEKQAFENLHVVHDRETHHRQLEANPSEDQLKQWRLFPPRTHPLVWTHASGRKSLMLGATATRVEGMDESESSALIKRLQAWAIEPQFVYSHEWQLGDLVIWNNHGVLHRVTPYALDSGRLMFRTALEGHEIPA